MRKTDHFKCRTTERGVDDVAVSILLLFGEQLDRREGLVLRQEMVDELLSLALRLKKGFKKTPIGDDHDYIIQRVDGVVGKRYF